MDPFLTSLAGVIATVAAILTGIWKIKSILKKMKDEIVNEAVASSSTKCHTNFNTFENRFSKALNERYGYKGGQFANDKDTALCIQPLELAQKSDEDNKNFVRKELRRIEDKINGKGKN